MHADCPGISLTIEFNKDYAPEFASYISDPSRIRTLPVEYYVARWRSFADQDITARGVPLKPAFIDATSIRTNAGASRYVVDVLRDSLSTAEKVDLALSYRLMKDAFVTDPKVKGINDALAKKKGDISDKTLSVSLDNTSRSSWEAGVVPHLDALPLALVGKGEQSTIKIKLAMESSADSHLVLVEEPENHLSFTNLNALISHMAARRGKRQLIVTTHSSFVLNKLGLEAAVLFHDGKSMRLTELPQGTQEYFMKLPGHDTLRLILSKRSILVEGPSDELIVQAAFMATHGKAPLDAGVDVISVNSLAFKRFLQIAAPLHRRVAVVTDNDGKVAALEKKYADFKGEPGITIHFDPDEAYKTLEPQLLKANGRPTIEKVLGRQFQSDADLLDYMADNKADVALKFFTSTVAWNIPQYIADAVA